MTPNRTHNHNTKATYLSKDASCLGEKHPQSAYQNLLVTSFFYALLNDSEFDQHRRDTPYNQDLFAFALFNFYGFHSNFRNLYWVYKKQKDKKNSAQGGI